MDTTWILDLQFISGEKIIYRNTVLYEACIYKHRWLLDEHIYIFVYVYYRCIIFGYMCIICILCNILNTISYSISALISLHLINYISSCLNTLVLSYHRTYQHRDEITVCTSNLSSQPPATNLTQQRLALYAFFSMGFPACHFGASCQNEICLLYGYIRLWSHS